MDVPEWSAKMCAAMVAGGYSQKTFNTYDVVRAFREEMEEDLNTMEIWTTLQDVVGGGLMVVNRAGQYRLTPQGIELGGNVLKSMDTGLADFGISDVG